MSSLRSTSSWFTQLDTKNPDKLSNDKCVSIDCEMVGVSHVGNESELARISIVNYYGETLMDKYVKPRRKVTDYRTKYSGITPKHLENAYDFEQVQREAEDLLKENLIIGQSPAFGFNALELKFPDSAVRDTSHYYYLFGDKFGVKQQFRNRNKPSLKKLAKEVLGLEIQAGSPNSVEDARICMVLYRLKQDEWESILSKEGNESLTSLDLGKCGICGSLKHVNSRCPSSSMRQNLFN